MNVPFDFKTRMHSFKVLSLFSKISGPGFQGSFLSVTIASIVALSITKSYDLSANYIYIMSWQ